MKVWGWVFGDFGDGGLKFGNSRGEDDYLWRMISSLS